MLAWSASPLARLVSATPVALALLVTNCGGPTSPVDGIVASQVVDVVGVPDRGLDPSVVAVVGPDGQVCGGVLLAADLVLTARHCVSLAASDFLCPASRAPLAVTVDPSAVHIYLQPPAPTVAWDSAGLAILAPDVPSACDADIAAVLLEWPIANAVPALASQSGVAEGSHVRTVGFDTDATGSQLRLREHVPVLSLAPTALAVGEATCLGEAGGPAFDETTGEVVGIMSRPASPCGAVAQADLFIRSDVFDPLIAAAFAWEPPVTSSLDGGIARDAGRKRDAGRSKKPTTDVGAPCSVGADCGAGVCVTAQGGQYCSEPCGPADRCPTDFKCVIAASGTSVCIQG